MASKKGTLLEKNVERLLRLSGLSPERNVIINTYEIDVFVIYKNKRIAFECKQYEKSGLTVRNLIHQWESKNRELELDKIVLVLVGCDISEKDYDLAKKYNITIWNEGTLDKLSEIAIEKKEDALKEVIEHTCLKIEEDTTRKEIERIDEEIKDLKERESKKVWPYSEIEKIKRVQYIAAKIVIIPFLILFLVTVIMAGFIKEVPTALAIMWALWLVISFLIVFISPLVWIRYLVLRKKLIQAGGERLPLSLPIPKRWK
jgi:penicillin-binding protein-related factor A (putative recombinase)